MIIKIACSNILLKHSIWVGLYSIICVSLSFSNTDATFINGDSYYSPLYSSLVFKIWGYQNITYIDFHDATPYVSERYNVYSITQSIINFTTCGRYDEFNNGTYYISCSKDNIISLGFSKSIITMRSLLIVSYIIISLTIMLLMFGRYSLIYLIVIQTILLILSLISWTISVNNSYYFVISIITCGFLMMNKEELVSSNVDNRPGEMNI
jgi:hypothetical protein